MAGSSYGHRQIKLCCGHKDNLNTDWWWQNKPRYALRSEKVDHSRLGLCDPAASTPLKATLHRAEWLTTPSWTCGLEIKHCEGLTFSQTSLITQYYGIQSPFWLLRSESQAVPAKLDLSARGSSLAPWTGWVYLLETGSCCLLTLSSNSSDCPVYASWAQRGASVPQAHLIRV